MLDYALQGTVNKVKGGRIGLHVYIKSGLLSNAMVQIKFNLPNVQLH